MVDTRSAATSAHDNVWFERVARAGYAASGLLHLLIAFIVARLAFGDGGNADQSGALATLAAQPGGAVMLWVAAIVLAALGLWQLVETFVERDLKDRLKAAAVGVTYLVLAFSAAKFAMGSGKSSTSQNAGMSARMMQSGWGITVLIVVALVLAGVGGYHVYKGATKGFLQELKVSGGSAITWIGIVGYVAKGLVLIGVGILVVVATMTSDPAKASGVDAAVKTLGNAPFGKILLIIAALGIAAYGVYGFFRSRYADMS
jgi:succinate dehydrogenase/fumarate reductase cytochrome b subunit